MKSDYFNSTVNTKPAWVGIYPGWLTFSCTFYSI